MIEPAFRTYTKAVETAFETRRCPPKMRGGLVEFPNEAYHLRFLVDRLEDGREFNALLEETCLVFATDGYHSKSESAWGWAWKPAISNFFRRTGYYTDTFAGSDTPGDLFERYENAFRRRHAQTTYLAPLEFVNFPKPEMKFPGFDIRKFNRNELDKIVGNDVNRVFYPHAVVDTRALQEYWFIVVTTQKKAPRIGVYLTYSPEAAQAHAGIVSPPKYTRFPPAIERVLERLVLFDWLEEPQEGGGSHRIIAGPRVHRSVSTFRVLLI